MTELAALTTRHLETFLLAFFRLGGMLAFAPILGHRSVPVLHRAGLAALLALVVAPVVGSPGRDRTGDALGLVLVVAGELVIGLAIGLVATLVMAGVQAAGELIGYQMGFGLAALYDPAFGAQVTVLTRFQDFFALLLVLSLNGHHLLIRAVAGSFQRVPAGALALQPSTAAGAAGVVALGGKVFRSGLELAAPVVGALLVINVALALLARVAPQTNVFVVGLPLTVAVGLFGVVETFPHFAQALARLTAEMSGDLDTLLLGAARALR